MTEREVYFWLSRCDGMTWLRFNRALERYGNVCDFAESFRADAQYLTAALTEDVYYAALSKLDDRSVRGEIERFGRENLCFATPCDEDYPVCFAQMGYDVPFVVYYVGDIGLARTRGVGIVGTRRSSAYGARTVNRYVKRLGAAGLTIVSGLAAGIDSHAHRAALEYGYPTIAVLGSGIKRITPAFNTELARNIVRAGGLVISEFDPEFGGSRYSYPHRNRLIAALSDGVVIAEAGESSGALYTANHANSQGKDIFLIPAESDGRNFAGIAKLYREGVGKFSVTPDDVLEEFNVPIPADSQAPPALQLDLASQKILDRLEDGALSYDSLFEAMGIPHRELGLLLANLQLFGLVECRGNLYFRTGDKK